MGIIGTVPMYIQTGSIQQALLRLLFSVYWKYTLNIDYRRKMVGNEYVLTIEY